MADPPHESCSVTVTAASGSVGFRKCVQKLFSSVCVGPLILFPWNQCASKLAPFGAVMLIAVQNACPSSDRIKSLSFVGVMQPLHVVSEVAALVEFPAWPPESASRLQVPPMTS